MEENWLEQMPDRDQPHPWVIASAVLAALALLVALYAVLRSGAEMPAPVSSQSSPNVPGLVPQTAQSEQNASSLEHAAVEGAGEGSSAPNPIAQSGAESEGTEDSGDLVAEEPKLLIVPAPAPDGRPLPRGADEIRRAVLGDSLSTSAQSPPGAALDQSLPSQDDLPQDAGVPRELKAEIDAFKESVKRRGGASATTGARPAEAQAVPQELPRHSETASIENTNTAPDGSVSGPEARTDTPMTSDHPSPDAPSASLRQRLPPYRISVHVYNESPDSRFVYINGNKLGEQEVTPEGLKIEEITEAGAIMSFEGEYFFERR
jgi:general secretion pathway protein B